MVDACRGRSARVELPYSDAIDAIDAFKRMEAWAVDRDVSIQPPFSVRATTTTFTDETRTRLRTPMMCLAVSVGDRLANVFPHSRGDDHHSVLDAITALKSDDLELFPHAPAPAASPPDRCPVCETCLPTVQGIGVCRGCNRIECDTASASDSTPRAHLPQPL